jgi:hypothetical protein
MTNLLGIKHDKITRALTNSCYNSKSLWSQSKVYVQELTQSKDIITLTFDDSIEEKRYKDESELNCWHFDPTFGRNIKGVNFLTALLEVGDMRLPVGVEFVKKNIWGINVKMGKKQRESSVTKNELFRSMLRKCTKKIIFNYVFAESWYSSLENMICCKTELQQDFIFGLKSNRKVALSFTDKEQDRYVSVQFHNVVDGIFGSLI